MSYGGTNGGNSSISTGTDVALNNPSDQQVLAYSGTLNKWTNLALGTAALQASSSFAPASGPVPAQYAASNDYRFSATPYNKITADYSLALSDAGSVVEVEASTNITVTVPPSSAVPLQGGTLIELSQTGAGQITVAAGTNVTLHNAAGLKSRTQWSSISLRKRPGGGSALPTAGLLARYRGDDLTGATNTAVASWPDTSGNNYPAAAQSNTTYQPKVTASAINGHKGVSFNGTNHFLSLSGAALGLAQNVGTLSVFVVYTCPTVSSGTRSLFTLGTGTVAANQRILVSHRGTSGNNQFGIRRLDADALNYQAGASVTAGETVCLGAVFNSAGGSMQLYRNGTQSAAGTVTTGLTSNTLSLAGALGSNPDGTSGNFYGTIGEILIYSSIDATTRAAVSTYVQNTYAISMADALSGTDEWVVTGDTSV